MGCSSSDSSSYIIQYCTLNQLPNKENIFQITLLEEEKILKEEGKKLIDQMGKFNSSNNIQEFLNRNNFETHTMFYYFLREEPILKNYEQTKKYFPYNLPQLYKVIFLSIENNKNITNLIIENKTKFLKESNFIGYKMDFNDMAKILEEVNNSKITKDSLSLRDEDLSFEGEVEEKEDELIICEQIKEETFIRISNKFKLENKEENYENNNLETSSNLINNINSSRRHNTKIKSIKIVESTIEDLIIFNKIMKFISKKNIKKFFFVGNNINLDFEGWEAISSFFEQNYNLRYLDLHNSTIYDYHLTDLMRPLSDKRIRFLNLSENFITIDGVKIIAEFLKNNKTLQKLNLSRNAQTQFKSDGVKCILESLLNNKNIECIDFSFMNLTGCGESIGNFITKNKSIENIVLKNVLLNFNDFKNIFVPLKKNKTLKEIDVSMNDMGGDKSLQIIADAIKENTSLECLRMDQININNDNYNIIFESIENNKTIQKYSINYNSDIKPKIVINFFMRQMQVKYLEYIPFDKENDNDKNKSLSLEERKMFEKLQVDRPDLKLIYK
jgi:hypothetical protein